MKSSPIKNIVFALITSIYCVSCGSTNPPGVISTPSESGAVTQYAGNIGRTGVFPANLAIQEFKSIKWQVQLDAGSFSPTYAEGVIYVGEFGKGILALDSSTGEQIWESSINELVSSVAIVDEIILISGETGLHAINRKDGKKLWSFLTDSPIYSSAPLILNGVVYVGSDKGTVYAVDINSHTEIWNISLGEAILWSGVADDSRLYFATWKRLTALDSQTGKAIWSAPTSDKWSPPAVEGDLIFAGNANNEFVALNTETGERLWAFKEDKHHFSEWSKPVVTNIAVYVGGNDNILYALDRQTGMLLWQFKAEDWVTSDPILADDIIYFGVGAHGNLVADDALHMFYALDTKTGQVLWTFQGKGLVYTSATLGGGAIYFRTLANFLYALQ